MLDLTVIILTKNEEKNIEKCINSFNGISKRFVVVDSYSDDTTKEICERLSIKYNISFYERSFISHADQFNWALKNTQLNTNWIMRIDADEEMTKELIEEFENKIPTLDESVSGVFLNRRIYFMNKWIKYGGMYPIKVLRLFRRNKGYCEQKLMDEHIVTNEGINISFKNDFIDYNQKNLEWWINKHNWYSNLEVNDYLKNKNFEQQVNSKFLGNSTERKRWLKNIVYYKTPLLRRAKWYFMYRYFIRLGFLDGKEGLIFHFLQGYWYRFLIDAKIHEQNVNNQDPKK